MAGYRSGCGLREMQPDGHPRVGLSGVACGAVDLETGPVVPLLCPGEPMLDIGAVLIASLAAPQFGPKRVDLSFECVLALDQLGSARLLPSDHATLSVRPVWRTGNRPTSPHRLHDFFTANPDRMG